MNERRLARLAEQIKQRLAQVLQRDLADPKLGLVTITRVDLDKEFTHCRAYWSVVAPTGKEAQVRRESGEVLTRARGFCQREMGKVLHTRTIPRLEFRFDEGIAGAIELNKLLQELRKEDDSTASGDDAPDDAPDDGADDGADDGPGDAPPAGERG